MKGPNADSILAQLGGADAFNDTEVVSGPGVTTSTTGGVEFRAEFDNAFTIPEPLNDPFEMDIENLNISVLTPLNLGNPDHVQAFIFDSLNNMEPAVITAPHIPAVSEWGMIVMVLLSLTAGTVVFARWRRPSAA